MRNIIILIVSIFLVVVSKLISAQETYPCVRDLSTNPNNPYNTEWSNMFDTDPGSFINSGFSWYNGSSIVINSASNAWTLPSNFPSLLPMSWPFGINNGHTYLTKDPFTNLDIPDKDRDFRWEDGWELLWLNLGILPNGDPISPKNANAWNPVPESPNPTSAPYFILYNRYRGTMRVFFNVWWGNAHYDDVTVTLYFDEPFGGNNISGVLRHVSGIDQAMDKKTEILSVQSPRRQTREDYPSWYVADFQLAYDPCQCKNQTKFRLQFAWSTALSLDLEIRTLSVEKEINKIRQDEKNFLQWQNGQPGNVIYKSIDNMLNDFNKAMDNYNDSLKDYKSLDNIKKELANVISTVASGVAVAGVSAGLTALIGKTAPLWVTALSKDLSKQIVSSGKKVLADEYDFLNTQLGVIKDKPIRPNVPVATFTEGRIKGTLRDTIPITSPPLFLPGTVPTAYNSTPNPNDITNSNFPAYNNVVGLFALLQTPKLQIYDKPATISDVANTMLFFPAGYPIPGPEEYPVTTKEISLRLTDGLPYALNPALDWDMDKTNVLFAFQLEFEIGTILESHLQYLKTELQKAGGNFELTHRIKNANGKIKAVLTSEYYTISDARKALFSLKMINSLLPYPQPITPYSARNILDDCMPILTKIKMKIAGDFWFNQLGYDGEQVNTFQVFTYELFNSAKDASLQTAIVNAGGTVETNKNWILFSPGTLEINSPVSPGDPIVTQQIGNTLYIRAETIDIRSAVGAISNYNLEIEALKSVNIKPGGSLLPNARASIKDFYGQGENPQATAASLSGFCSTKYKANQASDRAMARMAAEQKIEEERKAKAKMAVSLFPNPASSYVQIEVKNQPQETQSVQFVLLDIAGRPVLQRQEKANSSGQYALNLPQLSQGIYMLQITVGQQTTVEKLVIK